VGDAGARDVAQDSAGRSCPAEPATQAQPAMRQVATARCIRRGATARAPRGVPVPVRSARTCSPAGFVDGVWHPARADLAAASQLHPDGAG
jgi:hypothetical protein